MKSNLRIVVITGLVLVVVSVILLLVFNRKDSTQVREDVLKKNMRSYYEKYLKGKVIGVTRHQVSLEMLDKTGYDMKVYSNCDLDKSFSYIDIKGNNITVENHLDCNK